MWIPITLAVAVVGPLLLPRLIRSRTPPPRPEPGQPGYVDWNMKPIVVDPNAPYLQQIRTLMPALEPGTSDEGAVRAFQSGYIDGAFWYTYPPPIDLKVTGIIDEDTKKAIADASVFMSNPYYVKT